MIDVLIKDFDDLSRFTRGHVRYAPPEIGWYPCYTTDSLDMGREEICSRAEETNTQGGPLGGTSEQSTHTKYFYKGWISSYGDELAGEYKYSLALRPSLSAKISEEQSKKIYVPCYPPTPLMSTLCNPPAHVPNAASAQASLSLGLVGPIDQKWQYNLGGFKSNPKNAKPSTIISGSIAFPFTEIYSSKVIKRRF